MINNKKNIVIIEDDPAWLDLLKKLVLKYCDVRIHPYESFKEAKERIQSDTDEIIANNHTNLNLLITDIFDGPSYISGKDVGLKITEFLNSFTNVPVIIVTGAPMDMFQIVLQNYKIAQVFYKYNFDNIDFINCVKRQIGRGFDNGSDQSTGNIG